MVKTWNEHISIGFKFEDPPQQIRHLILRKQKQNILWEIALFCHGRNLQCGRWTTSNPVQLQQLNRNSWGWSTIFYVSKFFIYNCAQCNNYIHWIILNRWIVSWSSKSPFISTSVSFGCSFGLVEAVAGMIFTPLCSKASAGKHQTKMCHHFWGVKLRVEMDWNGLKWVETTWDVRFGRVFCWHLLSCLIPPTLDAPHSQHILAATWRGFSQPSPSVDTYQIPSFADTSWAGDAGVFPTFTLRVLMVLSYPHLYHLDMPILQQRCCRGHGPSSARAMSERSKHSTSESSGSLKNLSI